MTASRGRRGGRSTICVQQSRRPVGPTAQNPGNRSTSTRQPLVLGFLRPKSLFKMPQGRLVTNVFPSSHSSTIGGWPHAVPLSLTRFYVPVKRTAAGDGPAHNSRSARIRRIDSSSFRRRWVDKKSPCARPRSNVKLRVCRTFATDQHGPKGVHVIRQPVTNIRPALDSYPETSENKGQFGSNARAGRENPCQQRINIIQSVATRKSYIGRITWSTASSGRAAWLSFRLSLWPWRQSILVGRRCVSTGWWCRPRRPSPGYRRPRSAQSNALPAHSGRAPPATRKAAGSRRSAPAGAGSRCAPAQNTPTRQSRRCANEVHDRYMHRLFR